MGHWAQPTHLGACIGCFIFEQLEVARTELGSVVSSPQPQPLSTISFMRKADHRTLMRGTCNKDAQILTALWGRTRLALFLLAHLQHGQLVVEHALLFSLMGDLSIKLIAIDAALVNEVGGQYCLPLVLYAAGEPRERYCRQRRAHDGGDQLQPPCPRPPHKLPHHMPGAAQNTEFDDFAHTSSKAVFHKLAGNLAGSMLPRRASNGAGFNTSPGSGSCTVWQLFLLWTNLALCGGFMLRNYCVLYLFCPVQQLHALYQPCTVPILPCAAASCTMPHCLESHWRCPSPV
eukprot:scaffold106928_cov20-Tisochrysis_lutea.AAC.1